MRVSGGELEEAVAERKRAQERSELVKAVKQEVEPMLSEIKQLLLRQEQRQRQHQEGQDGGEEEEEGARETSPLDVGRLM